MKIEIIIYVISLECIIVLFAIVRNREYIKKEDYILLAIGGIPILNTLFIIVFFTLGVYLEYEEIKKQKIQGNKIYKILHTRK